MSFTFNAPTTMLELEYLAIKVLREVQAEYHTRELALLRLISEVTNSAAKVLQASAQEYRKSVTSYPELIREALSQVREGSVIDDERYLEQLRARYLPSELENNLKRVIRVVYSNNYHALSMQYQYAMSQPAVEVLNVTLPMKELTELNRWIITGALSESDVLDWMMPGSTLEA